ncbi:MAG: hypothetical protein LH477_06915, partial [Nocardioides sp.]|nr:hypothetical protein [Nocardioides sp.]
MPSENSPPHAPVSASRAVRHHLALVVVCLALGTLAGWLYAGSVATTYTSTARVLVNPSTGNPYVPAPSSVRQDEETSLETEAQVARSTEVLDSVAAQGPGLTTAALARGVQVTVPPNTQILEISYSATDPVATRQVTDAVASAYLENRARRFTEVNAVRIERVEAQTISVVTDLRAAAAAAQLGDKAEKLFQAELAGALRNELVSLRAQRTALENSDSPPGAVIAPASSPSRAGGLSAIVIPAGGALLGLALGCLLALLLERFAGVVRSETEVETTGLPVVAAVPPHRRLSVRHRRNHVDAVGTTIRRLRASILDLEPRPE